MDVVPNGVSPPEAPVTGGDLVGTLALFEPVKGLDVLIRAAKRLGATHPEVRVALFGGGSQEAALRALAAELGVERRVRFEGYVPSPRALARMAVFVLPSFMENSPMALLEAMAAGVPAVATRVGGVEELTGDTVVLVAPGDPEALATAVARLLDDPERRGRQARRARERVLERFTARANAQALRRLYARELETAG